MDTALRLRHVFGVNTIVNSNISYLEGDCVVFTAGLNVIVQNATEKTQKIISLSGSANNSITALAITPDKKKGVAAISASSSSTIASLDLKTMKRKKDIVCDELEGSSDIIAMEFDKTGQTLAVLIGSPKWTLLLWNWNKMVLTSTIALGMSGFSGLNLCPADPTLVALYGKSILQYMRLTEEASRSIPSASCYDVSCFSWVSPTSAQSVVGTQTGELLLMTQGNLTARIDFPFHNSPSVSTSSERVIAEVITAYSSGIIVADSASHISMYKQSVESSSYSCVRSFHASSGPATFIPEVRNPTILQAFAASHCFSALSVSSTEDSLALIKATGQILICSLQRNDPSPRPLSTYCHVPCHVSHLSFAATRPVIASCASDRTVRIWNYSTLSEECCKLFGEEPLAISLHPSGWHIAIGFVDRLRIYHLHMSDMKLFLELPIKNSKIVEFSDGGHLIAAASASVVSVYNFITAEKICDIRGHNGKIISMLWTERDSYLVTSGVDGAVYTWIPETGHRVGEFVQKATHFSSLSIVPRDCFPDQSQSGADDNEEKSERYQFALICGGINGQVQALSFPELVPIMDIMAFENASSRRKSSILSPSSSTGTPGTASAPLSLVLQSSCVALSKNAMIVSLNPHGNLSIPARIRVMQFPFSDGIESIDVITTAGHASKMALSKDCHLLCVADTAGMLHLLEVGYSRTKSRATQARSSEGFDLATGTLAAKGTNTNISAILDQGIDGQWSDGVIMSMADLDEQVASINDLEAKVEELSVQNEYQLNLRDMNHTERVSILASRFAQQIDMEKSKFTVLKEEKDDLQLDHEEKLRQIRITHESNVQRTEGESQKKLIEEVDRYQKLVIEKGALHLKHMELIKSLEDTHERYINELQNEFNEVIGIFLFDKKQRLREEVDERQKLEESYQEQVKNETEIVNQQEDDVDSEIVRLRDRLNKKLSGCKESSLKLKGEIGIMKKKCVSISKEMERSNEEVKLLEDRQKDLTDQAKALEKEIHLHRKEIRNRDVTINGKEKEIFELRRRGQELEKFKFVLDHKIRELKSQIEPKEEMIVELRDDIERMDRGLETIHGVNRGIDNSIGDIRINIEQAALSIKGQKRRLTEHRIKLSRFLAKLRDAASAIQDPEMLQQSTKLLASEIGIHDSDTSVIVTALEVEDEAQHSTLEQTVSHLKSNLQQITDTRRHFMQGRIGQNMDLVKSIKAQREENKRNKQLVQVRMGILQRVYRQKKLHDKIQSSQGIIVSETARERVNDEEDDMKTNPSQEFQENIRLISTLRNKKKILEDRAAVLSSNLDHGTIA